MVGNDQVDEPWLDEALTQYATLLYFEDQYGAAGDDGLPRRRCKAAGNAATARRSPSACQSRPTARAASIAGTYGAIVYGRGPLFFEALREEMGQEAFDAFLRDYVQSHRWGIATTEEPARPG